MSEHQWKFVDEQFTGTRFTWTITNYSSHYLVTGKKLASSIFHSGKGYKDQWRLEMFPRGRDESTKDSVAIYLKLIRSSEAEINASVKIEMLKPGSSHEPVHNKVFNMSSVKWIQGARKGFPRFAGSSELGGYVKNDTLKLSCEIEFTSETKYGAVTKPRKLAEEIGEVKHRLIDDLWLIFNNKQYSDAFITVGKIQFHVHKFILQTRSPILAAQLPNKSRKHHRDEILIDDMRPEVVQKMLHFIYTDKIDNFEGMLEDLLIAGHKYGLSSLKSLCEKHLCNSVDVRNVASHLTLADRSHAQLLKNYCSKFIREHLMEVIATPGYRHVEDNYPELACHLIRMWAPEISRS